MKKFCMNLIPMLSALFLAAFFGVSKSVAQEGPEIERADVERIVSTLASDDMHGRRAFSEYAVRAAEYLAGEFEAAGLESPEGGDYLQRFSAQTVTYRNARVTIDGRALSPDRVLVSPGVASFSWSTGDAEVIVVGPDDEPIEALSIASSVGIDALILMNTIHEERLRQLAPMIRRPVRTLSGSPGRTIVLALSDAGPEVSYRISGTATVEEQPLVNVVGMLPGQRTDEYVLFSAHYDHIGFTRTGGQADSIYNGANDNASGVSAVVTLGKYFARQGTPERTLLFAAFTAEETGGFGSRYYSNQVDPDQIVAMFNMEMIGKPAVEGSNTAWITGFERSSFGSILQEAVQGTQYEFYPDPYPDQNLFYRSDNATLARLGVPAHSISTTPIDVDQDYHQVTDHVETLDLDHLTNTIRAIAMGARTIISGGSTPTRVDPATVN